MSSSGAGRGRGWLNLVNAEPPRPTGLSQPPIINSPIQHTSNDYSELVEKIRKLNVNDDGIMFNKKMKDIKTCWLEGCNNKEDVEISFEHLYKTCLHDTDLATKLVILIASQSFIKQEIREHNLRQLFLQHLQRDFENSNQLQTMNPLLFRNCVHMIGEFFYKARLSSGEPFKFLATPFLSCLELLLTSKSVQDLTLFTTQLFLNGTSLKNIQAEELDKLPIKIRTVLVTESQLAKETKLWLLLALDLFSVGFGVIQPEIYKFYEDHLGMNCMLNFQKPPDVLSIQTVHPSKILDSFQSNVNVLQISTSPTETSQSDLSSSQFGNSSDYDSTIQNHVSKDSQTKEKTGRPILGVGARFAKNKTSEENGSWGHKQNVSGRSLKKPPPALKTKKGWEHDDRFENDYN